MLVYGIGIFIIGLIMFLMAKKKLKAAEAEEDAELKEALITAAAGSRKWGKINMIIGATLTIGFAIFMAVLEWM